MDQITAQVILISCLLIFVAATGYFVSSNRKDLLCKCGHYQTEHRLNFGLGGTCFRCSCGMFDESPFKF